MKPIIKEKSKIPPDQHFKTLQCSDKGAVTYECDNSSFSCKEAPGGSYANQKTCDDACHPPTCEADFYLQDQYKCNWRLDYQCQNTQHPDVRCGLTNEWNNPKWVNCPDDEDLSKMSAVKTYDDLCKKMASCDANGLCTPCKAATQNDLPNNGTFDRSCFEIGGAGMPSCCDKSAAGSNPYDIINFCQTDTAATKCTRKA